MAGASWTAQRLLTKIDQLNEQRDAEMRCGCGTCLWRNRGGIQARSRRNLKRMIRRRLALMAWS